MWIQLSRWGMFCVMMFDVKSTWDLKWNTTIRLCFSALLNILIIQSKNGSSASSCWRVLLLCKPDIHAQVLFDIPVTLHTSFKSESIIERSFWSLILGRTGMNTQPALKWIASLIHTRAFQVYSSISVSFHVWDWHLNSKVYLWGR